VADERPRPEAASTSPSSSPATTTANTPSTTTRPKRRSSATRPSSSSTRSATASARPSTAPTTPTSTIRVQPDGFDDVDVEIPLEDAARYEIAQVASKAAAVELTAAKGIVLDHIGTGRRAVANGRRIAYRIPKADGTTKSLNPYQQKEAA
jgi:hypothetical protein